MTRVGINFEKNTLPRYIFSQTLNILENSHFILSQSWPLTVAPSFSFSSSFYGFSSLSVIFLLLICGTRLTFFNQPITHQPFILLQPRGSPFSTHFIFFKYLYLSSSSFFFFLKIYLQGVVLFFLFFN